MEWGKSMEGGERARGEEPELAVKVRRCELMESGRGRESGVVAVRGESERNEQGAT